MTTTIGKAIVAKVIGLISGNDGANHVLAELTLGSRSLLNPLRAAQVRAQNAAADLAERSNAVQYPVANVFCEKITNDLREKFRTFSGRAQIAIELRHSQDRLDGLQDELETYADGVMQVLDANRGDWTNGMFYSGEYEATFGPVKRGGKNFIQAAKITFEIGVSRD